MVGVGVGKLIKQRRALMNGNGDIHSEDREDNWNGYFCWYR